MGRAAPEGGGVTTNSATLPKRRAVLERPKQRARVIALIMEGHNDHAVAEAMKVSRQAITAFRARHKAELVAAAAEVDKSVIDIALKDAEARIRELAWLYGLTRNEIEEYGITVVEERYEGRGETSTTVKTRDYRDKVVKEARGLLADIADELGQRTTKGGDINIDARTQVLVRQYGGFDLSAID